MSDLIKLDLNTARFNEALRKFEHYSKKSGKEILIDQARNFVRRVIALTPPSRGKANPEARKRGEAAVAADLSRIMKPGSASYIDLFRQTNGGNEARELFGHKGANALGFIYTRVLERGDLVQWHHARRRADGRVMQVNRDVTTGLRKRDLHGLDLGLVEKGTYEWFKKRVQARVGLLASGWNAAAEKLGYKPPQWIRRHGTDRGGVEITLGSGVFMVRISNDVPFASAVRDFPRRVQNALNQQAAAMEKRVKHFEEKNGKRAGFR